MKHVDYPYHCNPDGGLRLAQKVGEKVYIEVNGVTIEVMIFASGWSQTKVTYKAPPEVKIRTQRLKARMEESCENCGNTDFAVARDMLATRVCRCGNSWEPKGK